MFRIEIPWWVDDRVRQPFEEFLVTSDPPRPQHVVVDAPAPGVGWP